MQAKDTLLHWEIL